MMEIININFGHFVGIYTPGTQCPIILRAREFEWFSAAWCWCLYYFKSIFIEIRLINWMWFLIVFSFMSTGLEEFANASQHNRSMEWWSPCEPERFESERESLSSVEKKQQQKILWPFIYCYQQYKYTSLWSMWFILRQLSGKFTDNSVVSKTTWRKLQVLFFHWPKAKNLKSLMMWCDVIDYYIKITVQLKKKRFIALIVFLL